MCICIYFYGPIMVFVPAIDRSNQESKTANISAL